MIESPFAFFEMEIKSLLVNAFESMKPNFGEAPECFDAVDMRLPPNKFTLAMVHSEMFLVADIHESVVASPAITMNDAANIHFTSDNGL